MSTCILKTEVDCTVVRRTYIGKDCLLLFAGVRVRDILLHRQRALSLAPHHRASVVIPDRTMSS